MKAIYFEKENNYVYCEELLIRQANVRDYISACSDAIDESYEKGRDNERIATALDMLADNEPLDKIMKYSHLSKEKVLELQKNKGVAGK